MNIESKEATKVEVSHCQPMIEPLLSQPESPVGAISL